MLKQFSKIKEYFQKRHSIHGQDGSVILIVLMLLVIMSVIGIASTNTTVTENFIVRNTALRKQNLHMADAAAMEVVQRVLDAGLTDTSGASLQIDDILPTHPDHENWVRLRSEFEGATAPNNLYERWYNPDDVGFVLTTDDGTATGTPLYEVPISIQNGDISVIVNRGEANSSIRYAMVGWAFKASGAGNLNLASGQPILRTANILTEYMSQDNGVIRLTVGVEREFMN